LKGSEEIDLHKIISRTLLTLTCIVYTHIRYLKDISNVS